MLDLHIHSNYSPDSATPMEEIARKAIAEELLAVAFTEHVDFDLVSRPEQKPLDLASYYNNFCTVEEEYGNKGTDFLFGIELGLLNYASEKNKELVTSAPFDIIIGSTHGLYNLDISRNKMLKWVSPEIRIVDYYREIWSNLITFNDIDTFGHLDYIDRFFSGEARVPDYNIYKLGAETVLKQLIAKDIALEVNTAGMRKTIGYAHPKDELLLLYKKLGGEMITIGSDAHRAIDVGRGIQEALLHLKELGFKSVVSFKKRKPVEWGIIDLINRY
ncbi:MAG: histidinol-phosphatase HisJ family protein [Tissierellia bacterium]|nr:histidinol-phosphatase HisJ family protein [Tissierellia bacterium]